MELIRRRPGRATSVVVGALALVVLSGGLVAAGVVENAPSTQEATAKLGLTQLSGAQSLEESGLPPGATRTSPSTVAGTTAPVEATAGSTSAPPLPGHRTPGAVVTPFKAGRNEWSGVSNEISLRLVLSTPAPRADEPVTFVAEASMPGALCCNLTLEFGDGSEAQHPPAPGLGDHSPCSSRESKSSSVRGELRHVYNKGGRWNFRLTARSGGICGPSSPAAAYGSLEGTLAIGGGSSSPTPQGPSLPTVRPASIYPYEPNVITLSAEARDDDGHIDRLIVDWGDGSASQSYTNPQPCRTTPGGWPGGSYTILPFWMGVGPVTHRYRDAGPYKVTVTAISTSCERTGEQRVSGTLTFPEPLPPPPPFESIPLPPPSHFVPPPPIASLPVPPPGPPPILRLNTTTTSPARG